MNFYIYLKLYLPKHEFFTQYDQHIHTNYQHLFLYHYARTFYGLSIFVIFLHNGNLKFCHLFIPIKFESCLNKKSCMFGEMLRNLKFFTGRFR
jgi:hypothetical protein